MSSTYGEKLKITVFGQSHSASIGVTVEGLPAGFEIDLKRLQSFLSRRAPGRDSTSTTRCEADIPEFLSGLSENVTNGAPLSAIIRNTDVKKADYSAIRDIPRPGHADYTAAIKYGASHDASGGGHFSGRLTAPICIAGGIALQMLEKMGITIGAHIIRIGERSGKRFDPLSPDLSILESFPVSTPEEEAAFREEIALAKADSDSVGGMIEIAALGIPAGIGDPMFDGMENRIAKIVFGIPAVKGVEFGAGMAVSEMRGSKCNDPFTVTDKRVTTKSNNSGGILGGITNGMPLIFRAAIKPTPSIAKEQDSISLSRMENTTISVKGRHDPCIVPRAVPVMEAAAAIAILDAILCK